MSKKIVAWKPGDIALFAGDHWISKGIQWGTWSKYSHAAICCRIRAWDLRRANVVSRGLMAQSQVQAWRDGIYLVESTSMVELPCLVQGKAFSGVQVHRPNLRAKAYDGEVYRVPIAVQISPQVSTDFTGHLLGMVGTPYDGTGAATAGTMLWKHWLGATRAADRSSLYCVEMVAEAIKTTIAPEYSAAAAVWKPGKMTPKSLARLADESSLYQLPRLCGSNKEEV